METVLENTSQHQKNLIYINKAGKCVSKQGHQPGGWWLAFEIEAGKGSFRLKRNARGAPLFSCTPNPLSLPFQTLATQATRSPPASLPSITLKWPISKEHNLIVVWFHFHFLHPLCLELYHSGNLALYPAVSLHIPSAIFGCVWLLIGLQDSFLIYLIPQRVAPENFQVIGSRTLLDSVLLMLQLVQSEKDTDCESTMFIETECVVHAMLASLHINTK